MRDARGLGVMYAPGARAFTCVSQGSRAEIASYASMPELVALFRVSAQTLRSCCVEGGWAAGGARRDRILCLAA